MNDRVFRGRTVSEARMAAVEKLGPEAVVLTTRSVARQGVSGWFGAVDIEESPPRRGRMLAKSRGAAPLTGRSRPARTPRRAPARRGRARGAPLRAEGGHPRAEDAARQDRRLGGRRRRVEQIRALIEGLGAKKPGRDAVTLRLRALGIEGPAAAELTRGLKGKTAEREPVRDELARVLHVAPWPLDGQGVTIALVGPSGVGKTTTAAKLAARGPEEDGRDPRRVRLVPRRRRRAARRYANLMGADLARARTCDELRAILGAAAATSSSSTRKEGPQPRMASRCALAPSRRSTQAPARARHVLLCVPASLRWNDAARLAKQSARCTRRPSRSRSSTRPIHLPASCTRPGRRSSRRRSCLRAARLPRTSRTTVGALVECLAPDPARPSQHEYRNGRRSRGTRASLDEPE